MTEHPNQTPRWTAGTAPRIYVACLAAYNNGHLHGCWIDASQEKGGIQAAISAMLKASPVPYAEEWAIHDHEGIEGVELHEYSGIDRVVELAAFIGEHGRLGAKLIEHFCGDIDQARDAFDNYVGQHRSLAEFAQELTEETTEIPPTLANYIDYEAIARDMELGGDVFTIELGFDEFHVFWAR